MRIDPAVVRRVHASAANARWRVPAERLAEILSTSADKGLGGQPASTGDVERYVSSLHLDDLVLSCACMTGDEAAWEYFLREYRPLLYRAADAMDATGDARELADALYAELFGLPGKKTTRASLLRYFHGRSSLATWLRTVLTQRFIAGLRTGRRNQSLDDDVHDLPVPASPPDPERDRHVALMQAALTAAIETLDARDRLRLGCYYADELTLAETGRILHEHEASVSRHLARTRQVLKAEVEQRLRENGLTDEAIAECFSSVTADAGILDVHELLGSVADSVEESPSRKETSGAHSRKERTV